MSPPWKPKKTVLDGRQIGITPTEGVTLFILGISQAKRDAQAVRWIQGRVTIDRLVGRRHQIGAVNEVEADIGQIHTCIFGSILVEIEHAERKVGEPIA